MRWLILLGCLFLAAAIAPTARAAESTKDAIDLRQTVTLDFDNLTLDQCADRLRTLTKRKVIVHESLRPLLEAREQRLLSGDAVGLAALQQTAPPVDGTVQPQQPIGFSCSLRHLPLGSALRVFLEHYGLGYAAIGEALVIATADKASQMRREQPVELNFANVPLAKAVDDLAGRYGITLVLDAQAVKDATAPITLTVRDLSLDEAVHLLADCGHLKAGPLSAGWILTTPDKARAWQERMKLARESAKAPAQSMGLPGPIGGGMDAGSLVGGLGGAVLGGTPNWATVDVPPALLQTAGPPPRVGQTAAKISPAVPQQQPTQPRKSLAAATLKKMSEPFGITHDAPLPLKEAIKLMEDNGFPKILIRLSAFRDESPDAGDPGESPIRLPGKGLSRAKALRLILDQVSMGNANYLVRPGYILVTTNDTMLPNHQFVTGAAFVQRTLDDALQELSELSGISIVLDPRVGEKAKTLITARFPAETNVAQATRILADMADLKAVRVDTIMYVTTRSNNTAFPEEAPTGGGKYTKREVAE